MRRHENACKLRASRLGRNLGTRARVLTHVAPRLLSPRRMEPAAGRRLVGEPLEQTNQSLSTFGSHTSLTLPMARISHSVPSTPLECCTACHRLWHRASSCGTGNADDVCAKSKRGVCPGRSIAPDGRYCYQLSAVECSQHVVRVDTRLYACQNAATSIFSWLWSLWSALRGDSSSKTCKRGPACEPLAAPLRALPPRAPTAAGTRAMRKSLGVRWQNASVSPDGCDCQWATNVACDAAMGRSARTDTCSVACCGVYSKAPVAVKAALLCRPAF